MAIFELLHDLVFDYTLRTVALGSATLGIVSGALGTFAVLRRQALLGDAMAHAALPGIALAFLLTGSKAPLVLIVGAAIAGWLGTLFVMSVIRSTRVKDDSALGLVLSVFFGFGLLLLTLIQKRPDASQAGLDTFLFGQAAALLTRDVVTMGVLSSIVLGLTVIFWKEFKLLSFDREFGASLGLPMRGLDVLLTSLLVLAIVIGLQTVGVVLMSAMVVAPAAAARQWTDRLSIMVSLSALFGALAGVSGAVISASTHHLPTGPMIVLCISAIVVLSLAVAPNRGLVWARLRRRRNTRRMQVDKVLADLLALAQQHDAPDHGHEVAAVNAMNLGMSDLTPVLEDLCEQGLVQCRDDVAWSLTPAGLERARSLADELAGGDE